MPGHYGGEEPTSQTGSAYNDKYHKKSIKNKHSVQSKTNDTDHGGVSVRKRDTFGYYGNNGGHSTYLAGNERLTYTDKKRAFYSYDKHHGLEFKDPKEEVDQSDDVQTGSVGGHSDPAVAPPVVMELSIDRRAQEQQRLVGLMQKNRGPDIKQ